MKMALFVAMVAAIFCCADVRTYAAESVKALKAAGVVQQAAGERKKQMEEKMSKSGLKCVFLMCNDVAAMQKYYGEILKLKTEGVGGLVVSAGVDLMFFKGDYELPVQKEWAWQPGYKGGAANVTSFSIELAEAEFKEVFLRLQKAGSPLLKKEPEWRQNSFWGLTTKDPMGNTLELFMIPPVKPQNPVWPG